MSDTFNYALLKKDNGNYVLRSTLESHGLQQVTDKDVVAFYKHFSSYAYFDTGLLPLNGTGILSIRSAGEHMQVAVQHAPGAYHINWGAHEGARDAKAYYLAQPYRIVVGDFVAGNLLGAKMFYSPFPITYPDQQLYHVNLPNINCKGYKGNAVGWICLYLKENWSQYSFNEKVAKLIERCSGVETYNDANMSETDGPRFYKEYHKDNSDFKYLWSPDDWQQKTESEGFQWTLNEDLWIKILVQDIDNQDKHVLTGVPLTFAMSVLGNYQAYYSDKAIPKLYNLIARKDFSFENQNVASMIKSSFALTPALPTFESKDNPFASSVENRKKTSSIIIPVSHDEEDEDDSDSDSSWECSCCNDLYEGEDCTYDSYEDPVCNSCINSHYIYLDTTSAYYHKNDNTNLYYSENLQAYLHAQHDRVHKCINCNYSWGFHANDSNVIPVYQLTKPFESTSSEVNAFIYEICAQCIQTFANAHGFSEQIGDCEGTKNIDNHCLVLKNPQVINAQYFNSYTDATIEPDGSFKYESINHALCPTCASKKSGNVTCACGLSKSLLQETFVSCEPTLCQVGKNIAEVSSCCQSCIGDFSLNGEGIVVGKFVPFNTDLFNYTVANHSTLQTNTFYGSEIHTNIELLDI